MAEAWRLFVAAALPEDAATAVWEALAPLRADFPAPRWMRPEQLHFTLVFMGQVESDRVPAINERLALVAERHAAFETIVDGAGGHVDDGASRRAGGVAWLTLSKGFREVVEVAIDVDTQLETRTHDDRRRPRPHLTVARGINAPALGALRELAPTLRLGWQTSEISLFRSHLGPGGSNYEPLGTDSLGKSR